MYSTLGFVYIIYERPGCPREPPVLFPAEDDPRSRRGAHVFDEQAGLAACLAPGEDGDAQALCHELLDARGLAAGEGHLRREARPFAGREQQAVDQALLLEAGEALLPQLLQAQLRLGREPVPLRQEGHQLVALNKLRLRQLGLLRLALRAPDECQLAAALAQGALRPLRFCHLAQ